MLDDAGRWPSFGAAEEDRELAILVLALRWLEHCMDAWTALQADRMVEEQQSTKHATEAYVSSQSVGKIISLLL